MQSDRFRPRSATELLDATIQLVRQHPSTLLTTAALMSLPFAIVLGFAHITIPAFSDVTRMGSASVSLGAGVVFVTLLLIALIWYAAADGALALIAADAYHGRVPDVSAAFRAAIARLGPIIGVNVVKYLAIFGVVMIGSIVLSIVLVLGSTFSKVLAIVLGVGGAVLVALWGGMVYARYFVAVPAVLIESRGAMDSLRRSTSLTVDSRRSILGAAAVIFVLSFAVNLVFGVLQIIAPTPQVNAVLAILGTMAGAVVYGFTSIAQTLFYFDTRIRREAYDLELQAAALDAVGAAGNSSMGSAVAAASA